MTTSAIPMQYPTPATVVLGGTPTPLPVPHIIDTIQTHGDTDISKTLSILLLLSSFIR